MSDPLENEEHESRWESLRSTDEGFIVFVQKQYPAYSTERIKENLDSFKVFLEDEYLDLLEVGEKALRADFKFSYQ